MITREQLDQSYTESESEVARHAAAITDLALRQPETATDNSYPTPRMRLEPTQDSLTSAPSNRGHRSKPTDVSEAAEAAAKPLPDPSAADRPADPTPAAPVVYEAPAVNRQEPDDPPDDTDHSGIQPPKPPKPPSPDTAGAAAPDPDDDGSADKNKAPKPAEVPSNEVESRPREVSAESAPDFRRRIDAITSRTLTPETIDTYADDALNTLIGVIGEITERYDQQQHQPEAVEPVSGAEHERAALVHFGFDGDKIEATLDRISSVAAEIAELDDIIAAIATPTGEVITPPDPIEIQITPGGGEPFRPKELIPRLKTVLFILSNQFDIDLLNPEECNVEDGITTTSMMRQESYRLVVVPALNRSVLVCDELGNATFVFDTAQLTSAGIDRDTVKQWTKEDIKAFLASKPGSGRRLVYSETTFTAEVTSLLETIPAPNQPVAIDADNGKFLENTNQTTRKYRTGRIARELGTTHSGVSRAASALAEELGEVESFRSKPIYSAEQRALIHTWLEEHGYLAAKAQEGYSSVYAMSKNLSVAEVTVREAIQGLGENLGAPVRAKAGNAHPLTYSPDQQALIRTWLIENKKIAVDSRMRVSEMATLTGLSVPTLRTIIDNHVEELGEVEIIGRKGRHLTLPQQEKLLDILDREGYLVERAPAGYSPEDGLPTILGCSRGATLAAIAATKEEAGEPGDFMIGTKNPRRGKAYSPAQQAIMRAWLETNGYLVERAPQGYFSESGLPAALGYSRYATQAALAATREEVGEPGNFMIGTKSPRRGKAYSPAQQAIMRGWLEANGYTPTSEALGAVAANGDVVETQPDSPAADQ